MSADTPPPPDAWAAVDAVVVVNLDSRPDRWESFRERNGDKVPPEKLHRLSAVNGRELPTFGQAPWFTERTGERARMWGGVAGCILSHRNAIRMAQERGWRNVLIVEDDVSLPSEPAQLAQLDAALENLSGAWFLYLGYGNSRPYGTRIAGDLWRVEGVLGTFAYMVSNEAYEQVLAQMPDDDEVWTWIGRYRAIDTWYRDYMPAVTSVRVHCINPTIVEHLDLGSDIVSGQCDASSFLSVYPPKSLASVGGLLHLLNTPFRRLKVHLNSLRTVHRLRKGGLPGFRKKH